MGIKTSIVRTIVKNIKESVKGKEDEYYDFAEDVGTKFLTSLKRKNFNYKEDIISSDLISQLSSY